jgi:hypothetical protein
MMMKKVDQLGKKIRKNGINNVVFYISLLNVDFIPVTWV